MKHFKTLLIIVLAVVSINFINAQDEDNRWSIDIGTNWVDFYPTGADFRPGGTDDVDPGFGVDPDYPYLGSFGSQFFNTDHWNNTALISYVRVGYYVGSGFSVALEGSMNGITHIGDYTTDSRLQFWATDVNIRYNFVRRGRSGIGQGHGEWFDPYLLVGGGYTSLDGEGEGTLDGGIGINFWFTDMVGLNVQTQYKHSFNSDVVLPYFQHVAGVTIKFGAKDSDGDGVWDKHDACPDVFGLEQFNGCPDSDGDGIQDSEDACPNTAGLPEFNGCPDTDGDGIPDKDDSCPNEAGPASTNGCPDRDGDGVADKDDKCPDVAGPAENNGCPWPDSDGDGVLDKDDKCPNVVGVAENYGCPLVTEETQKEITDLARAIYFNTGKATFTDETSIRLEAISKILSEYTSLNFTVEGHTDSTGSKQINDKLSQARAEAVMNYIIENGFPADKIKAKGFGSANPIGDNKTRKGRQQNRRVEIYSEHAKR